MTRTCEQSFEKLSKVLHTLIVWSNIFYLIGAFVSFYSGHPFLGVIFLLVSAISTIHHSNWKIGFSSGVWERIDVFTATGGTLVAFIYGGWYIYMNRHSPVFRTRRTIMISVLFVLMAIMAMATFIMGKIISNSDRYTDPNKGFFGPLTDTVLGQSPDSVKKFCSKSSKQILYMVYHTIWHIMSGIVGIFLVILITIK